MKKLRLIAVRSQREAILQDLMLLGCVEISEPAAEPPEELKKLTRGSGEAAEEHDEQREEGSEGHAAAEDQPAEAGQNGEHPAEQKDDDDGHALLDRRDLIRPVEVGAHRAEQERDGGEQHAVEQRHKQEQHRLEP